MAFDSVSKHDLSQEGLDGCLGFTYKEGMQIDSIIQKLRDRRASLDQKRDDENARHARAIAEIAAEAKDLATAERVLVETLAPHLGDLMPPPLKPVGLPTMPQMIAVVLGSSREMMEPKEIHEAVQARFWDGFKSSDVGPTAWRMWKRGELVKDGDRYGLPVEGQLPIQPMVDDDAGEAPADDEDLKQFY